MPLPRLSNKEYLILELLIERGEMFGLQLVQRVPDRLARGTVYVTLQRMATKGFVASRVEAEQAGPPRRWYRHTALGYRMYTAIRWEYAAALR